MHKVLWPQLKSRTNENIQIYIYIYKMLLHYWGEPERAPHRSVVDVGGTSVAYPTIYTAYTVVVGGTSVA